MLALFVGTVTIGLASYARTVILDATIEGARFAALADQSLAAGAQKTRELVQATLGSAIYLDVSSSSSRLGRVESIRFVSSASFDFLPETTFLIVSSVATREFLY
jgi:tetrahydromethanopterin S-methyltransferase subunit E